MCSIWIVNGRRCESGSDLVAELGVETARGVNMLYEDLPDERVAAGCLCHVDAERLRAATGLTYEYDVTADAFTPLPAHGGDAK